MLLAVLVLGTVCPATSAARDESGVPVRIGVYAPYLFHPGFRSSAYYEFAWHERTRRDEGLRRFGELIVGPHLALAARIDLHVAVFVGAEIGYRFRVPRRDRFHELTFATSYVAQSEKVETSVDLSSGDQDVTRELRNYALPALRYTLGRTPDRHVTWYMSTSFGWMVSAEVAYSVFYDFEFGVQVRVGRRESGGTP